MMELSIIIMTLTDNGSAWIRCDYKGELKEISIDIILLYLKDIYFLCVQVHYRFSKIIILLLYNSN